MTNIHINIHCVAPDTWMEIKLGHRHKLKFTNRNTSVPWNYVQKLLQNK